MNYFSPKSWARMESPILALRVWGTLQWHRSTHRYTRALRTLRALAPAGLAHASEVPLTDSIVLGIKQQGDTLIVELHGSTRAGTDERMQGDRVQLVFRGAQILNRPPTGSWILQEEWSELTTQSPRSLSSAKGQNANEPNANAPNAKEQSAKEQSVRGGASAAAKQRAAAGATARRFRFTAMCTRGLLCIDCDDAELIVREVNPQSGIISNVAFAGIQARSEAR